jgi:hypothetical protein
MQPLSAHHQHRIHVNNEHDVIAMRQEVRQVARTLGLGLVEQAKIATAISAVARVMLVLCEGTMLTMRMTRQGDQSVLEITCAPVRWSGLTDLAQLEEQLNLANARLLVDEANLSERGGEPVLTLRMRLARSAR